MIRACEHRPLGMTRILSRSHKMVAAAGWRDASQLTRALVDYLL